MSTSEANPLGIRWAKFGSGERLPLLVRRSDGLPVEEVADWTTAERRAHKQARTLEADLENLQFLLLWAEMRGVDIEERLVPGIDVDGRLSGGGFFTTEEMRSFCGFCGLRLREALEDLAEARSPTPLHHAKRAPRDKAIGPRGGADPRRHHASPWVKRNRIQCAHAFLRYLSGACQRRLAVHGTARAEEAYAARRKDTLEFLRNQYRSIGAASDDSPRRGLSPGIEARLRAVIEPGHPENPWGPGVQLRNLLIVLLLLDLGIRRGELLGIRTDDLLPAGKRCVVTIHRRPDDPLDPRTKQPTTKTLARELLAGERLAALLWDYVREVRSKVKGARRHPFLIVDVATGRPLSLSSVNKLFAALRKRVPDLPNDLVPHALRHTFNDNLSRAADRTKMLQETEEKVRNHANGWSPRSKMSRRYTKRHTEEQANRISVEMQEGLSSMAPANEG